jgi:hypothetical protein
MNFEDSDIKEACGKRTTFSAIRLVWYYFSCSTNLPFHCLAGH